MYINPSQKDLLKLLKFIDSDQLNYLARPYQNPRGLFDANVHSQELPKLSKFTYLWNALLGEAKESVRKFQVTADNYSRAITFLHNREVLAKKRWTPSNLQPISMQGLFDLMEEVLFAEEMDTRTTGDAITRDTSLESGMARKMLLQRRPQNS
ncbi:hypothetical protein COOONC_28176 [Cooperia oncophora]